MILLRKVLLIALLFAGSACSAKHVLTIEAAHFSAQAMLQDVDIEREGESAVAYVRGSLRIAGKGQPVSSANLNCFGLQIGQQQDAGVYVDRVAHVLPGKVLAKDGVVMIDVYWVFNQMDAAALKDAKLFLRLADDSCVQERGRR